MVAAFPSLKFPRPSVLATPAVSLSVRPAASLLTPERIDLAVKWRLFNHLSGGDDADAIRVYLWHIGKRRDDGFVDARKANAGDPRWERIYLDTARALHESMWLHGFAPQHAVPLDGFDEILGGAHRIACALSLNIPVVTRRAERKMHPPAWGHDWFVSHGMADDDLARLDADWATMTEGTHDGRQT